MPSRINYTPNQSINGIKFIRETKPYVNPNTNARTRKAEFKCPYCGKRFEANIADIKKGDIVSCGCRKIKMLKEINITHGLTKHPLYSVWKDMRKRCSNPNNRNYKYYGDRGISICSGWMNNFKSFYDFAMSNGWEKGLQIDRINNNGNYEPSNCRFVTNAENCRNRRTTKLNWDLVHEIRNAKLLIPNITLRELADAYNVTPATIGDVLNDRIWKEK